MNRLITFSVIFTFWLFWSGMFDAFHIALGILSSLVVVVWTGHLFVESRQPFTRRMTEWIRFETYSIWLLWQIILANIQVFKLAFHPNVLSAISPTLVTFNTSLIGDVPQFIFAQSITLTPGTVTVSIKGNEFKVHAINHEAAAGLPGDMERRIKAIYNGRHNA